MKTALLTLAFVLLLASAAALVGAIVAIHRYRYRRESCAYCGFDRSAVSASVCGECGRPDMPARRIAIATTLRAALALVLGTIAAVAGLTATQPVRMARRLPDPVVSAIAPISPPTQVSDPLIASVQTALHEDLASRMRAYPFQMSVDEQRAVVARVAASASQNGTLVVVTAHDENAVELTITLPTRLATQRRVALVLRHPTGRVLVAYQPWRTVFMEIQIDRNGPRRGQAGSAFPANS